MSLTVKRKYLKTVEVMAGEEYQVPRNQQIITSRIIHEITPESNGPVFPTPEGRFVYYYAKPLQG